MGDKNKMSGSLHLAQICSASAPQTSHVPKRRVKSPLKRKMRGNYRLNCILVGKGCD